MRTKKIRKDLLVNERDIQISAVGFTELFVNWYDLVCFAHFTHLSMRDKFSSKWLDTHSDGTDPRPIPCKTMAGRQVPTLYSTG